MSQPAPLTPPNTLPPSKITGGHTSLLFTAKVLGRLPVRYFRCEQTGFIQTEEPYWLDEAYVHAISPMDVGYVSRNLNMSQVTAAVIVRLFGHGNGRYLDYGGGCGLLTRLMRDAGYDFYRRDPYCQNLFAQHFDLEPTTITPKLDMLTAFEVFEHLVDPMRDIRRMFELSDTLLFSTDLVPQQPQIRAASDWPYFSPEHGQHVAFYTSQSLAFIAHHFEASVYTLANTLHLLTRNRSLANPLTFPLQAAPPRPGLAAQDWQFIRSRYAQRNPEAGGT